MKKLAMPLAFVAAVLLLAQTLAWRFGMPLVFAAVGVGLLYKAHRNYDDHSRYNFNNMTDGGVVQFTSYEVMKGHGRLLVIAKLQAIFGTLILLFAALVLWKVS